MSKPQVSVIIPSYNREKLIVKAIHSVLNQTYQDFEILVIDDASTDNTEQVIKGMKKDCIRYFRMEQNGGQCIARNFGIQQARGKYIGFLDSDDEWLPEKLRLQVACFESGPDSLGVVYCFAYQTDVIKDETSLINSDFLRGQIQASFFEGFCPPTPSLFLVKNEALSKVGGFDEKLLTFVDLDIWMRISQFFAFDYIEEPLIIKFEQIGDQYVNNFEKRYAGYHLFLNKWQDEIIRVKGKNGLMRFKRNLAYALIFPILEHPPVNMQRNAHKIIRLLISIRSLRWKYYLKAILILLFGPKIIYLLRKQLTNT